MRRAEIDISANIPRVQAIAEDVRVNGDDAVIRYTQEFDKVTVTSIKVTEQEIEDAYNRIDDTTRQTLTYAANNIRTFHEKQMPQEYFFKEVDRGLMVGEKSTPIEDVCLYVPRGKGSFPSVLLMLGIPAVVAGVQNLIVTTPPNESGNVDDAILAAAKIIGIRNIYKAGGIQAIAAIAFGTQTIPKCKKVVGPGSQYVTAAKRALSAHIDIGPLAGPSESIILCDEYADPHKAALDLMIEAEHGTDSAALLVTHSEKLINAVLPIIEQQLPKLSPKRQEFITTNLNTYGGAVLTESLDQSIDFVNDYAPEHMEVMTQSPFDVMLRIKNAGEILLGENTPITLGNFLLGLNAILPTGGHAKTVSCVSVHDFLKRSSIGYATPEGYAKVKDFAYNFAMMEGFDAHARAVKDRQDG